MFSLLTLLLDLRYGYFPRDGVPVRTSVTSRGLPCFVQASTGLILTRTLECLLTSCSCNVRPKGTYSKKVWFVKKKSRTRRKHKMASGTVIKLWDGTWRWGQAVDADTWTMRRYKSINHVQVWLYTDDILKLYLPLFIMMVMLTGGQAGFIRTNINGGMSVNFLQIVRNGININSTPILNFILNPNISIVFLQISQYIKYKYINI